MFHTWCPKHVDIILLFSSPHLMEVRERIRINGKPLPKDKFAKYFFDCWDNLLNNGDVSNQRNIMTCICNTCFNSKILLLLVLVHFFYCPLILSWSRYYPQLVAMVYIAKRKIILSLVLHWIIKKVVLTHCCMELFAKNMFFVHLGIFVPGC